MFKGDDFFGLIYSFIIQILGKITFVYYINKVTFYRKSMQILRKLI